MVKLLNLERKVTTIEEAQDLIVHMRNALATVYSDKRKLEGEVEFLNTKI